MGVIALKRNNNRTDDNKTYDRCDIFDENTMSSFKEILEAEAQKSEFVLSEKLVYIPVNSIKKGMSIPVTIENKKVILKTTYETLIIESELPSMCHALLLHTKNAFNETEPISCECKLLISDCDYGMFKGKSHPEMYSFAQNYSKLSETQRKLLKDKCTSTPVFEENKYYYEPITDIDTLKFLFSNCKHTYSPTTRTTIQTLFSELGKYSFTSNNKADVITKLTYILNINNTNSQTPKTIEYNEVIDALNRYVYGMSPLKKLIADRVMLSRHSGKMFSILLIGSPGVGKTSVAKPIAQVFDLPFVEIKCEGLDPTSLTGVVSSYAGSIPSVISTAFYKYGTSNVFLLFDEIDKLAVDESKVNPYAIFNTMLGPQRALHDEYLDADIDCSNTIIIATANDTTAIPDYIKNRFSPILHIDNYSQDEKVIIAQKHAIPQLFKENNISSEEIIFNDDVLHFIVQRYCDDYGARKVRSCIDSIICAVVSGWSQNKLKKPFKVTNDFVIKELDELYLQFQKENVIGFTA